MRPIGKAFSYLVVGAIALVALLTPVATSAQTSTATVTASAYDCTGLNAPGLLGQVGSDCTPSAANFTFYLVGDGTDDSWNLSVNGSGSANVPVGNYEVYESVSGVMFNLSVPADGQSFAFGFPAAAPAPPPAPAPPAPSAEMATLTVNTYGCTGVVGAPVALGEVGPDCTRIATNLDFYLWGDGTDASWNLNTSNSGPVSIDLQVGGYDVINTSTWETVGTQLPSGGATLNIGYAMAAAPAPAPAPETATLTVNTYACTGVIGAPIALGEIGPDCTRMATNLDFYLWGDGTDDSWNLNTSATGPVSIDLQVGGYDVINTSTWETIGTQLPSGGATLNIGYASVAVPAPAPDPVAETATLTVNTYACTGVSGAPIALGEIGPDCTRVASNLDFYLWGDGSDASWNLITSATGPVTIDLQVGGYEVVNTSTWATLGAQLPSGGTTLNIGYAADAVPTPPPAPETATLTVNTYACTGVTGAPIALGEIGPDCTRVASNLDFYLWGDGTDDSWNLNTSATGPVTIDLQVGGYEVVNTSTWATLGAQLPSGGTTLNIGYAAEPAPPVVETAVMSVEVYSCTGVTGNAIVLGEIGPDCVRVSTDLEFYLWGDGTDDFWTLTSSAAGPVNIELPVGGYEVWDVTTWQHVGVQVPADGGSVAIGLPAAEFGVTP